MIELQTDAIRTAAAIVDKAHLLEQGIENGVQRMGEIAHQQKVKRIGRTYARPIPLSSRTRTPLWARSGDWQSQQAIEEIGRFGRRVRTIGSAEEYEPFLADLPTGADGVNRTNAAGPDAERIIKPQLQPAFEQEVFNSLDS